MKSATLLYKQSLPGAGSDVKYYDRRSSKFLLIHLTHLVSNRSDRRRLRYASQDINDFVRGQPVFLHT